MGFYESGTVGIAAIPGMVISKQKAVFTVFVFNLTVTYMLNIGAANVTLLTGLIRSTLLDNVFSAYAHTHMRTGTGYLVIIFYKMIVVLFEYVLIANATDPNMCITNFFVRKG